MRNQTRTLTIHTTLFEEDEEISSEYIKSDKERIKRDEAMSIRVAT